MAHIFFQTSRPARILMLLLLVAVLSGCAAKTQTDDAMLAESSTSDGSVQDAASKKSDVSSTRSTSGDTFEDYGDETSEQISDPLESWNRIWFSFNDFLLLDVFKPVYTGYAYVVPQDIRTSLGNVLHNVQMPVRFTNSMLQGKFGQAGVELGRFMINTTVGMGGLFDVAKGNKPRFPVDERGADFGQTLAYWGFGEGIYLVWPLLGPSTVRDTAGMAGDFASSSFLWLTDPLGPVPLNTSVAIELGLRFNDMGAAINAYEALTRGAIEPYIAARDAYVKFRRGASPQ